MEIPKNTRKHPDPQTSPPKPTDFIDFLYTTGYCLIEVKPILGTDTHFNFHHVHRQTTTIIFHRDDTDFFESVFKPDIRNCKCLTLLPPGEIIHNIYSHSLNSNLPIGPFPRGTSQLFRDKIHPKIQYDNSHHVRAITKSDQSHGPQTPNQ
jgi:hypothetical protein